MSGLMPFGRRDGIANIFDEMEKSFFGNWETTFRDVRTDILDKGDSFILQAELPGFNKEDIHIDLDGNRMTIRAQHNEAHEEKNEDGKFIRRERSCGAFERSFDVSEIDVDEITAEYKNGILEMKLPKTEPKVRTGRKIDIK